MPKGGKRRGAGRPKGRKDNKTLTKELGREALRAMVLAELQPMTDAQIANAKGISYLVYRNRKTGKFERVKSLEAVDQEQETIEVWEKDPAIQAYTDLMNRALDKPAEQVKVTGEDGGPVEHVFRWQR